MKHRKLELKIPTEDYYELAEAAENELRTIENEAVYQIRKKVQQLLGQKEKRNDD